LPHPNAYGYAANQIGAHIANSPEDSFRLMQLNGICGEGRKGGEGPAKANCQKGE